MMSELKAQEDESKVGACAGGLMKSHSLPKYYEPVDVKFHAKVGRSAIHTSVAFIEEHIKCAPAELHMSVTVFICISIIYCTVPKISAMMCGCREASSGVFVCIAVPLHGQAGLGIKRSVPHKRGKASRTHTCMYMYTESGPP